MHARLRPHPPAFLVLCIVTLTHCTGLVSEPGIDIGDDGLSAAISVAPNPVALSDSFTLQASGMSRRRTYQVAFIDADGVEVAPRSDVASGTHFTGHFEAAILPSVGRYRAVLVVPYRGHERIAAAGDLEVVEQVASCTGVGCGSPGGGSPGGGNPGAPGTQPVPGVSGANYVEIRNDRPLPASFLPFAPDAPWNRRLPENPQHVDGANSGRIRQYAAGSGATFMTLADDGLSGCSGICGGIGGYYPVYYASASDPAVTVDCSHTAYGCSGDGFDNRVSSIPGVFHIPANARPGCTSQQHCGDVNLVVIQPDGAELELYGCVPQRDWRNGDVVGGEVCGGWVSGVSVSNVVSGSGLNAGTLTGGDNFAALNATYNEVVVEGSIPHALELRVTCITGSVYPGHGAQECDGITGVPSGALVHLRLSHEEIEGMIASGAYRPEMRPFLYALHDFGGYVFDTAYPDNYLGFYGQPRIEDASPWLRNGGTNPWIPWFQANGAYPSGTETGNPTWAFDVALYAPITPYLEVLSSCYAQGTCTD